MRKIASKKKTSLFRKLVLGPVAPILAAIVGGVFSLTAALVPRVVPIKVVAIEPAKQSQPSAPQSFAHVPTAAPELPAATIAKTYEKRLGEWMQGGAGEYDAVAIDAVPQLDSWSEIAPFPNPSIELPAPIAVPSPVPFQVETLNSSLAQAEAKSPAKTETPRVVSSHRPNLTYGVWTIFASDARGTVWNNSTLKIKSQQVTRDGLQFAGFLDWRADGKHAGREYVVGNYDDDTRILYIEGHRSAGNDRQLALSACSARLSEDGRRLMDGTWGSASAHRPAIPGRWQARR